MRGNVLSCLAGLQSLSVTTVSPVVGQNANDEKAKDDQGAAASAGQASGARAAFDADIEKWKQLLKDLRKTKLDFNSAPEADAAKFQQQWTDLVVQGRQ